MLIVIARKRSSKTERSARRKAGYGRGEPTVRRPAASCIFRVDEWHSVPCVDPTLDVPRLRRPDPSELGVALLRRPKTLQ